MSLTLTKLSETSSKITLGWTPVAGAIGYRFQSATQAPKWSHTWDATRDRVTFSKAAWYKVEALGVEAAGEYPPSTPPPTGQPIPSSGRITQGGTYSGVYSGGTIVIDTPELVTIANARITSTSGDMFRGLGGGFTIKNLLLDHVTGICQASPGNGRRIFDADGGVESIIVRSCTFTHTTGMKLSGQNPGMVFLCEKTRLVNNYGDVNDTTSQFVQFNAVPDAARLEIAWCEFVCDDPDSFTEDIISISSDGVYVHDILLDGQWAPGNPASTSQGGITLEEGATNSRVENNVLIATTAGVVGYYNIASNNLVLGNRVVRSSYYPDGVTRSQVGYSGLVMFPGSPGDSGNFPFEPQNGNHAHGNVIGFQTGTIHGGGRMDYEDNDFPPDCLPLNTHLSPAGGTITIAHENAERTRWQNKKAAAGITVGA